MTGSVGFLPRIVARLDAAGVPYMVTGSVASSNHGIPRTTHNVDLVIDPKPAELRAFVLSLPIDEYYSDLDSALAALDLTKYWEQAKGLDPRQA
ncbi:MAG: hypothetical protein GY930_00580 [bacterium]|nr:hypothetical protein [bacterium]